MSAPRRPLLAKETRDSLARIEGAAARHSEETGGSRAYAQGVIDLVAWLRGGDMTPMLTEITR